MGFSSFCALIFCILLNYPRFDGIYRYVDSSIMLELYTSKCAMQELVYISYFLYFEEKSQRKTSIWGESSDQVKDKLKKKSLLRLGIHTLMGFQLLQMASTPLCPPMVFFASAFGTKKLVSWINWCALVLSDYSNPVSCFKGKVKRRLLDQYCSSVVSFLIKSKFDYQNWYI